MDEDDGRVATWPSLRRPTQPSASSEIRLIMEDSQTMWYDVRDQAAALDDESGQLESMTQINDGTWHHVVAVVGEENAARLYIDGMLECSGAEPFFHGCVA